MKSDIASIRTESSTHRSQLNELNNELDKIFIKYTKNNLGYKEMKKQISKILKLKEEIFVNISNNIRLLEEIENNAKDDNIKKSSSKVIKIK